MKLTQAGKNNNWAQNREIDFCCFNLSMSTLKSILFSWHVFHARMGQWILCSELHLFNTKHARCHALTHKRRRGFAEREAVIFQKWSSVCGSWILVHIVKRFTKFNSGPCSFYSVHNMDSIISDVWNILPDIFWKMINNDRFQLRGSARSRAEGFEGCHWGDETCGTLGGGSCTNLPEVPR